MCIFGLRSYCFFLKYPRKSGKNIEKYSSSTDEGIRCRVLPRVRPSIQQIPNVNVSLSGSCVSLSTAECLFRSVEQNLMSRNNHFNFPFPHTFTSPFFILLHRVRLTINKTFSLYMQIGKLPANSMLSHDAVNSQLGSKSIGETTSHFL